MDRTFGQNFAEGFFHILDPAGYDHMLFLAVLIAVYRPGQWKRVAGLVTAFTVGHSLTLALSAFDVFRLGRDLVEFLIAFTILLAALSNFLKKPGQLTKSGFWTAWVTALLIGLIHGMGFSNYFRFLQFDPDASIVMDLLGFNVGLEVGQLLFTAGALLLVWIMTRPRPELHRWWNYLVSSAAVIISILLMVQRKFW